jgi:hypothetical protein
MPSLVPTHQGMIGSQGLPLLTPLPQVHMSLYPSSRLFKRVMIDGRVSPTAQPLAGAAS